MSKIYSLCLLFFVIVAIAIIATAAADADVEVDTIEEDRSEKPKQEIPDMLLGMYKEAHEQLEAIKASLPPEERAKIEKEFAEMFSVDDNGVLQYHPEADPDSEKYEQGAPREM
eukprot:PhM_4_TR2477/c0_g1_i1/m.6660